MHLDQLKLAEDDSLWNYAPLAAGVAGGAYLSRHALRDMYQRGVFRQKALLGKRVAQAAEKGIALHVSPKLFKSEPEILESFRAPTDSLANTPGWVPGSEKLRAIGKEPDQIARLQGLSDVAGLGLKFKQKASDLAKHEGLVLDVAGTAPKNTKGVVVGTPTNDARFATDKTHEAKLFGKHMPRTIDFGEFRRSAEAKGHDVSSLGGLRKALQDEFGSTDVYIKGTGSGRGLNVVHPEHMTPANWRSVHSGKAAKDPGAIQGEFRRMADPQTTDALTVQQGVQRADQPVADDMAEAALKGWASGGISKSYQASRKARQGGTEKMYRVTALDGKVVPYATFDKSNSNLSRILQNRRYSHPEYQAAEKHVQSALHALPATHRKGLFGFDVTIDAKTGKPVILESNPAVKGDLSSLSGGTLEPAVQESLVSALKGKIPRHIQAARAATVGAGAGLAGLGYLASGPRAPQDSSSTEDKG